MHFFSWRTTTNDENNNEIDDNGVDDTTTTTTSDALYVVPLTMTCMYLGMMLSSSVLQKMLGLRTCMIVGGVMMSGGVLMASFATRLEIFLLTYAVIVGTGIDIVYTIPIAIGWRWYPRRKGLVSGTILAGFGSGGFVFDIVGTMIVNPHDHDQSLLVAGYGFETVFIGMAVLSVCAGILVQGLGRI